MEQGAFGERLRRRRLAAGLTQEALAERAGLSTRAVLYLERGRRTPYPETIVRLADALALPPAERLALAAAINGATSLAAGSPPRPSTPLVGREREVAAVAALLAREDARLLTLTGTGGVGKTRLALAVADASAAAFVDGVTFVDLSPLRDPDLVLPTLARALGRSPCAPELALERLIRWLAQRHHLLVIDNFEQVASAAVGVAALTAACSDLRVLATSRTALRVHAEQIWPVPTLSVPMAEVGRAPKVPDRGAAVALFVQRARAVDLEFALTASNAPVVAEICRRLDGLPLAIELAAAWVRVLSPTALLARLGRPLDLLTGGAVDLPARQRTLRATLAWSEELLGDADRALFRQLAIFSGGADLESIGAVCGDDLAASDPIASLSALVDGGLVRAGAGLEGDARFDMLETVRAFALERLASTGERAALARRHAIHFLHMAEDLEGGFRGGDQAGAAARLDAELDNLRSALGWSQAHDRETGLRLAGAIYLYWDLRGLLDEGRAWFGRLLGDGSPAWEPPPDVAPAVWARALRGAGVLARMLGDYDGAAALLEADLRLARSSRDARAIAYALHNLGNVALSRVDYARALDLYRESLALKRALGDAWGVASSLVNIGNAFHEQGDLAAARSSLEEALLASRGGEGHPGMFALALHLLGGVAQREGDLEGAQRLFEEALQRRRDLGDRQGIAYSVHNLGVVALERGDTVRAAALVVEGLELSLACGDVPACAAGLLWLGATALARARPQRAALLLAASAAQRASLPAPPPPMLGRVIARCEAEARTQLGDVAFDAAWAAGAALSLEASVAAARPEAAPDR